LVWEIGIVLENEQHLIRQGTPRESKKMEIGDVKIYSLLRMKK
jgi:hypothetical protein